MAKGIYDSQTNIMSIQKNKLIGIPGTTIKIFVFSEQIKQIEGFKIIENAYKYTIEVQIRKCEIGEIEKYSE